MTRLEQLVTLLKKLQNPFALVIQGFFIGGLLFWTTQGDATPRPIAQPSAVTATN